MALLKYKNYDIYYNVTGEGKPILVLNGIMMSTLSWEPLMPQFGASNKVIRLDMLDQGQSSKATSEYTQDVQVEIIKALLDELKISKVNIVGISYGGEVALQFAVKYQSYIDRLVLSNTTAYTSPWIADIGKAWNIAAQSGNGESYYFTTIPVIYSPSFYEDKLNWMRNREKVLFPVFSNKVFTDAMIRLTNSANTHNVVDKLKTISVPTLVIGADQDYLTPFPQQELINREIVNSKLVKICSCGHASMYEQPLVFTSLVLGFINISEVDFKI